MALGESDGDDVVALGVLRRMDGVKELDGWHDDGRPSSLPAG